MARHDIHVQTLAPDWNGQPAGFGIGASRVPHWDNILLRSTGSEGEFIQVEPDNIVSLPDDFPPELGMTVPYLA
jgi:hypothetical protein